jgi:hypothetical protein
MPNAEQRALLEAAFGSAAHPLATWYAELLADRALQQFTAAHATKIRKKLRAAGDAAAQRDLRCELAVAARLADLRSPLSYEPMAGAGRRGPDFLLRHKGHTEVYVEVSRLRPARSAGSRSAERLASMLCGKLGQLAAGAANLLVLVSDAGACGADEVGAALQGLRRRADARDDAFFAFRGLPDARALHQLLPRLGAVLVAAPAAPADALWPHPQARQPLPADLARAAARWELAALIGHADA